MTIVVVAQLICGAAFAARHPGPVRSLLELRRERVVLQQWDLSCAAAALATVLRFQYGLPVTERSVALGLINREEYLAEPELIRLRQGFSLYDLKRYVEKIGLEGFGFGGLEFSDLLEKAPVIIPINLRGFNHFVVFRGATEKEVLLADPAYGNVTLSIPKFLDGWYEYQDIGRVGFIVARGADPSASRLLKANASDFSILRRP